MSIIEGASVSVKTMSDGTLRLSIDIEPRNAQAAFMLFGAPGRAVALAALKDGSPAVQERAQQLKGGPWAKLAGMWCDDADFKQFIEARNDIEAAAYIRAICCIESRVELDHNGEALEKFNIAIRYPFMEWMKARGIKK